jgi:hypothetical protein
MSKVKFSVLMFSQGSIIWGWSQDSKYSALSLMSNEHRNQVGDTHDCSKAGGNAVEGDCGELERAQFTTFKFNFTYLFLKSGSHYVA